nr:immunoglobulin heavy chain junction region [Macaca mulatta]MOW87702.1 immunoglobulin heavy chain junction region [Macaca mulatta]MOW87779.1 immunoglobulin heavy chain junction region [Macaca mulatta]MOW87976.1 immunoglobulin heavy chain junction region [Macaca mulatta]MOW88657.1 immunoglobulin heavy chain junction region [Macaca mulatta]
CARVSNFVVSLDVW